MITFDLRPTVAQQIFDTPLINSDIMSVLQRILKIWQEDYLHSFIVTLPGEVSRTSSML